MKDVKFKRGTPQWNWEQALIDDYYDHMWREALDPLHDTMHKWLERDRGSDNGNIDIDKSVHETHKASRKIFNLFTEKRRFVVITIQMDHKWFEKWVADNPPPPDIELLPEPFYKQ
jgi:hypothetical protein